MKTTTKTALGPAGLLATNRDGKRRKKIVALGLDPSLLSTFMIWCGRLEPSNADQYAAQRPQVLAFLNQKLMIRADLADKMIVPFLQFFDSLTAQELQNTDYIMAWFTLADRSEIKQRYKNEAIELEQLFDMAQIDNQIVKSDFVTKHRHRILAEVQDWRTTAPRAPMRQARPPQPIPTPKPTTAPASEPPPKPAVKPAVIQSTPPTQTLPAPAVTAPKPPPLILTSSIGSNDEENAAASWLTEQLKNWQPQGVQPAAAQKAVIDILIRERGDSSFIGTGYAFQSAHALRGCILSAVQFLGIEERAATQPSRHKRAIHLDQTQIGSLSDKYPGWKSQMMQRYRQRQPS